MSTQTEKSLKGIAGVHFVVAILSRLGYVALPTTRNLKAFDIVAFRDNLSKTIYLQVKTTDKPQNGFPVVSIPKDATDETWKSIIKEKIGYNDDLFYVFVALPKDVESFPDFYIVPSQDVVIDIQNSVIEMMRKNPKVKPASQLMAWGYKGLDRERIEKLRNNWDLLDKR
jgi:hypothetical protein